MTSVFAMTEQEQQQAKPRQLASDERQCRNYLTLATETVEMFHYLSTKIVEPFLVPVNALPMYPFLPTTIWLNSK